MRDHFARGLYRLPRSGFIPPAMQCLPDAEACAHPSAQLQGGSPRSGNKPSFGTAANASAHITVACGGTSPLRASFGLVALNSIALPGPALLLPSYGLAKAQIQVLQVRTAWESLHASC